MAFVFSGAGVALVTPFIGDKINYDALGDMIERQIEAGMDALIALGTTGEPSTMTLLDRECVARFCVKRAGGRVPVIVGAGGNDTRVCVETAKRMRDAGADALLTVTPYYNKATQTGLIDHFTAIADAAGIPVMLYNVPSRTGVNMLPQTANELKKHPLITAYKEASESITQLSRDVELLGSDMDVFAGNDEMTLAALAIGAAGVVSVAANVDPWSVKALAKYFSRGDIATARELQYRVSHLSRALFYEVSPIPCKAALDILGLHAGRPRPPLTPASDECRAIVSRTLKELGLTGR